MAISKFGRVTYDTLAGALAGARPDIAFVSADPGVGAACETSSVLDRHTAHNASPYQCR